MLRQLGIFFFISTFSLSAYAENDIRYYDVEFILFEHLGTQNRQSENWNARRLPPESEQAELSHQLGQPYVLEAESPYDKDAMFTLVPDSEKQLIEEAKLIEKSKTRKILAHVAWRQPGLPKDQAVWVQFKRLVNNEQNNATTGKGQPVGINTTSIDFLTGDKKFKPYIEGKVKVMLARYLHVDTEILYFAEPSPPMISESDDDITSPNMQNSVPGQTEAHEPEVFLLKQLRRRIRSKELHYLDQPVIGMLLMITPYEKTDEVVNTNSHVGYKTLGQ